MIPWVGVRGIPVGALAPVAVDAPMKRRAQFASALDLAGNLARTAPVPNIAGSGLGAARGRSFVAVHRLAATGADLGPLARGRIRFPDSCRPGCRAAGGSRRGQI